MDTAHWPQEIGMKPMEEIVVQNTTTTNSLCSSKPSSNSSSLERRGPTRPQKESAINCPRCNSTNTKFCYYNNYSLSQPRYFCKTCRRYWTEGGSLRNVPVGGGSRKNKRSSSSSISSSSHHSSMSKKLPDLVVPSAAAVVPNPNRMHHHHHHHHQHGGQDLNLGFPSTNQDFKTISELIQVPNFDKSINNSGTTSAQQLSALELLTGMTTRGGGGSMMNSFMPIPIPDPNSSSVYSSSMIPMPEFKIPSLNFSLDGNGMGSGGNGGGGGTYGSSIHDQSSSGRLLFPFEDLKTTTSSTTTTHDHDHGHHHHVEQNRDQNGDTNGFWSGMLGGSSW